MIRLGFLISCLILAGCSEFTDGGAGDIDSNAEPVHLAEAVTENAGVCSLQAVESADAGSMSAFGSAAGWALSSDSALACSEPLMDQSVECELPSDGVLTLTSELETRMLKNETGQLVRVTVMADAVQCEFLG